MKVKNYPGVDFCLCTKQNITSKNETLVDFSASKENIACTPF